MTSGHDSQAESANVKPSGICRLRSPVMSVAALSSGPFEQLTSCLAFLSADERQTEMMVIAVISVCMHDSVNKMHHHLNRCNQLTFYYQHSCLRLCASGLIIITSDQSNMT